MGTVIFSELVTELQTDPLTLGYASLLAAGNDAAVYALLNDKSGPGSGSIDREFVNAGTLQSNVVATEYLALTAAQRELWLSLMVASQGNVEVINNEVRNQIIEVWGPATTTRTNMSALQTRTGSRAEVLWGDGAVVSYSEIARARGG